MFFAWFFDLRRGSHSQELFHIASRTSSPGVPPAEGTLALRDASRTSSRPGAPYGPNRNDWAFALLRTAPRREETPRKKTTYEILIHISLNSAVSHVGDGTLDCSIRVRWSLLKNSVILIRFLCRTLCIFAKEHKQTQMYAVWMCIFLAWHFSIKKCCFKPLW